MILLANSLRVLTVALLLIVMGLSVFTLRSHLTRLRQPGVERRRSGYIVRVAVAHVGALALITFETVDRWGSDAHYIRGPVVLLLVALTLSAMVDLTVFQHQRRLAEGTRKRRATDT